MVVAASHGRGLFYGIFESEVSLNGDLNTDDTVNILDVVILVNSILDNEFNLLGDLNQDGLNNVLDIVQLINLILN